MRPDVPNFDKEYHLKQLKKRRHVFFFALYDKEHTYTKKTVIEMPSLLMAADII